MTSLYVHVPFCVQKCSYCAFYSLPLKECMEGKRNLIFKYLTGIEREIEMRHSEAPAGVSSLFLGGGTPTALSACELECLLKLINEGFEIGTGKHKESDVLEKSVEANPGTIDRKKLKVLNEFGINRISMGAQSFNDYHLQIIGRIHTAADIREGVRLIRETGFHNLNLDLMFGLPGQTMGDWQDTVKQAVSLAPEHLSLYALTLEEGTPLARRYQNSDYFNKTKVFPAKGKDILADDDLQADMYEWAVAYLSDQGYLRYEIANFARTGFECRHNQSYWQGEDYIGLGPGGVSCLDGIRFRNTQDINTYTDNLVSGLKPVIKNEVEHLTRLQLISEYVMLGLRTSKGIDQEAFAEKFQENIQDIYGHKLVNYIDRKIILRDGGRIRINPDYLLVANSILSEFIL